MKASVALTLWIALQGWLCGFAYAWIERGVPGAGNIYQWSCAILGALLLISGVFGKREQWEPTAACVISYLPFAGHAVLLAWLGHQIIAAVLLIGVILSCAVGCGFQRERARERTNP